MCAVFDLKSADREEQLSLIQSMLDMGKIKEVGHVTNRGDHVTGRGGHVTGRGNHVTSRGGHVVTLLYKIVNFVMYMTCYINPLGCHIYLDLQTSGSFQYGRGICIN